jgi:hypothetical protein
MFIDENPRIAVVGPTGSGKTTLARQLASRLGIAHIDADDLFWEPDWTPSPPDVLRARLASALAVDRWVTDGNIGRFRDVQLPRTMTLVWLDYPLRTSLTRLLCRTVSRCLTREIIHGGNRESFRRQFFSPESVLLFALRRHAGLRQHYEELVCAEDARHLNVLRLRSPRETRLWLQGL